MPPADRARFPGHEMEMGLASAGGQGALRILILQNVSRGREVGAQRARRPAGRRHPLQGRRRAVRPADRAGRESLRDMCSATSHR